MGNDSKDLQYATKLVLRKNNSKIANQRILEALRDGRTPRSLIITCVDPHAGLIDAIGSEINDYYVYRNIANIVNSNDTALQATLRLAFQEYRCYHVYVIGHSNCTGIRAAEEIVQKQKDDRVLENGDDRDSFNEDEVKEWVRPVVDLIRGSNSSDSSYLSKLNVARSVRNLVQEDIVTRYRSQVNLIITGLLYDVSDGSLEPVIEFSDEDLNDPSYHFDE